MSSFLSPSLFLKSVPSAGNGATYKLAKESFVSDNPGTSLLQIYAVSLTALTSLVLYNTAQSTFPTSRPSLAFLQQFTLLVVPFLLVLTVFSSTPFSFNTWLFFPAMAMAAFGPDKLSPDVKQPEQSTRSYPPLTIYRAHLMIITILSILAVDFPMFPRALGKTEAFGYSMMDLGVGSFVFSAGIAAVPSIVREHSLVATLRKATPLLVLGLLRVVFVKASGYPEHVSEYGVHWNFFLTMGLMPILTYRILPILQQGDHAPMLLAVVVTTIHQAAYRNTPLQEWALGTERLGIVGQNKEGLASLPGYFALHLFGIATGMKLPMRSASSTAPAPTYEEVIGSLWRGVLMAAAMVAISFVSSKGGVASRRLANTAYVAHTVFYNLLFLLAYVMLDAWFSVDPTAALDDAEKPKPTLQPKPTTQQTKAGEAPFASTRIPALLRAINTHGFLLFLLANILTGVINLVIPTMYVKDWLAMVILALYAATVFGVGWYIDMTGADQLYNSGTKKA